MKQNNKEDIEREAVKFLHMVWESIDFSSMSNGRIMRIWGEFEGKLKFASYKRSPEKMLEYLKRKFGIVTIKNPKILETLTEEVLEEIRDNSVKLILILRNITAEEKKIYKAKSKKKKIEDLFEDVKKITPLTKDEEEEIEKGWEEFLND